MNNHKNRQENVGGDIVAAIKFDAQARAVAQAALALAAASHRHLRLVHVLSPEYPTFGADLAGDRLLAFAASLVKQEEAVPACDVLVGEFPEALLEDAASRRAALVITGAATKDPGLFRAKLRHTYRLMAKTALPVLVLPDGLAPLAMSDRHLRILIADDLTDASCPALLATMTLISLLARPLDILHVHVERTTTLKEPDQTLGAHHQRLLARLRARAEGLAQQVAAVGGRYRAELWHGNVAAELSRAAAVSAPDVTVFGQHQFMHKDRLALGSMPFASMLGMGSAILVAPPVH